MLAVDFFPVDRAVTLKRIYVFFALEVGGRHVHILEATSHPTGAWTTRQALNPLMDLDERTAAASGINTNTRKAEGSMTSSHARKHDLGPGSDAFCCLFMIHNGERSGRQA
jgi:hypothetical protein